MFVICQPGYATEGQQWSLSLYLLARIDAGEWIRDDDVSDRRTHHDASTQRWQRIRDTWPWNEARGLEVVAFEVDFCDSGIDRDDVFTTRTLCKDSQHQDIRSGEQRYRHSKWMAEVFIHAVYSDLQSSRQSEPKGKPTKERVTAETEDCGKQGAFGRCKLLRAAGWIAEGETIGDGRCLWLYARSLSLAADSTDVRCVVVKGSLFV